MIHTIIAAPAGVSRRAAPSLRLCFVGPMIGRHPGRVLTQELVLADKFSTAEYHVTAVSSKLSRYARLVDVVGTLVHQRNSMDVICLSVYGGPSFVVEDIASWLARFFHKRLVMVLHGGALPEFMCSFPRWACRVLARADHLVVPSDYLARTARRMGFDVCVIPNLISLEDYPFRLRGTLKPRLFWMRCFHPIWNPEMALRVVARVRRNFPDVKLVMGGSDIGHLEETRRLASNLGVGDVVTFPGFLSADDKIAEFDRADVFLNTNRIDNMPVALVEAWAMGLPVVTTDVGGIRDLVTDGDTGIVVPDNDDRAMAEAVERLLSDELLARHFSLKGRQQSEQSAWENVHPQWVELFESVMKRGFTS